MTSKLSLLWRQTKALMQARATLNVKGIMPLVTQDVVYKSQSVLTQIKGKEDLERYLLRRFEWIRMSNLRDLDLRLALRWDEKPAIAFCCDDEIRAIWQLTINAAGQISRIDILDAPWVLVDFHLIHERMQ